MSKLSLILTIVFSLISLESYAYMSPSPTSSSTSPSLSGSSSSPASRSSLSDAQRQNRTSRGSPKQHGAADLLNNKLHESQNKLQNKPLK